MCQLYFSRTQNLLHTVQICPKVRIHAPETSQFKINAMTSENNFWDKYILCSWLEFQAAALKSMGLLKV